ncbi:MAG: helix-turn-helix domain-containing protein [Bacteroidota bacterium]
MNEMIFLPKEQIKEEIQQAIRAEFEAIEKKRKRLEHTKLLTINAVAKRLGKNHSTIRKLCETGAINRTKSGLIEENEIEKYLNGK